MTATLFRKVVPKFGRKGPSNSSTETFCRSPELLQQIATLPAEALVKSHVSGLVRLSFLESV